jgi:hypothetical protein
VERPTGPAFALAIGVAVGFAGLGKINVAIVGLVIATIGVAGTARRPLRSLVLFGVAAVTTFLFMWLAAGQRLADLPAYIQAAIDLSVGYSQSMGGADPQTEWTSGVALLVTLILVALFWRRTSTVARRDLVILCPHHGGASDLLSRLEITLTHGASWSVSDGRSVRRLPLGTATEPNIIGSTVDTGYRGAPSLSTPPATVTIGPEPGAPGIGTPLTLEFEVIPLIGP